MGKKRTLATYERFFGERYDTHSGESSNTQMHVRTQKMWYLLKMAGVEIGDFDYSWNFKGPFSPGLLVLLRSMDRKDTEVQNFYGNDSDRGKFLAGQETKVDYLRRQLEIDEHRGQYVQWVEILGSLAYISRTMLPRAGFKAVNQTLVREKPEYRDEDVNRHAWNLLYKTKLLSPMAV